MSDFRLPPTPGTDSLPEWRRNPAYADLGLSAESVAALDESEREEAALAARLHERTAAQRALAGQAAAALKARHAEQTLAAQLSDDELREELATSIDRVASVRQQVAEAEQNFERARECVENAEVRCSRYSDLDAHIASYRVEQIKSGEAGALPSILIEARREQRDAAEMLEVTRAAFVNLAGELQAAQRHVYEMAQARDMAAVAVISRHCDAIANEIEITLQRLHDLRQQVLSISATWIPLVGGVAPLPVSDKVRNALRKSDKQPTSIESIKTRALDLFVRLQTDARATIEP
jgi:hypothetical protein